MPNRCKDGKHSLEIITTFGPEQNSTIVRWCSFCGAIVIDTDCDGRTRPGAVMSMQFPECHNQKRSLLAVVTSEMINGSYRAMCPICTESNVVPPDSKPLFNCSSCDQELMIVS